MTRPTLNRVPLTAALPFRPGVCVITMSPGQWDAILAEAYRSGWVLLELNDREQPVAAYRRAHRAGGTVNR